MAPVLTDKEKRALKYALSMLQFQEVGMGPDKNLQQVRQVVADIKQLCYDETGIELNEYPNNVVTDLSDEKSIYSYIPLTVQRMLGVGQWEGKN